MQNKQAYVTAYQLRYGETKKYQKCFNTEITKTVYDEGKNVSLVH